MPGRRGSCRVPEPQRPVGHRLLAAAGFFLLLFLAADFALEAALAAAFGFGFGFGFGFVLFGPSSPLIAA